MRSHCISRPILTLCFSLFTTVLASKGLLAVPLVAWLVTRIPDSWFAVHHWRTALPQYRQALLARKAALLAAAILALADPAIEARLSAWRAAQTEAVAERPSRED